MSIVLSNRFIEVPFCGDFTVMAPICWTRVFLFFCFFPFHFIRGFGFIIYLISPPLGWLPLERNPKNRSLTFIYISTFFRPFCGHGSTTEPRYQPKKVPPSACRVGAGPGNRDRWKPTVLGDTIMLRRYLWRAAISGRAAIPGGDYWKLIVDNIPGVERRLMSSALMVLERRED